MLIDSSKPRCSLTTLPTEIQGAIFRLLDPIGLISISQTNSQLRRLIQPTRSHWFELLLALEGIEEIGGKTPVFRSRNNQCEPASSSPEWQSMRWACTNCLHLLPSTAFDQHSLLRLCYRKPIPGSPASRLYTSWEPSRIGRANPIQNARRKHLQTIAEKKIRKRYDIALTYNHKRPKNSQEPAERLLSFQENGLEVFANMTISEFADLDPVDEEFLFDQEANLIELVRCGYNRHIRKCNECRYQTRELRRDCYGKYGTDKVPIVALRRVNRPTALDRFLPGISEVFDANRPAYTPVRVIWRQNIFHRVWTEWMVRCPGCGQWKEARKFMLGSFWGHWQPTNPTPLSWGYDDGYLNWDLTRVTGPMLDNLRCGPCYVRERGRDAYREEFMRFLRWNLSVVRDDFNSNLMCGWNHLGYLVRMCPKPYRKDFLRVISGPQEALRALRSCEGEDCGLSYQDVAVFRLYRAQWMDLRESLYRDNQSEWIRDADWFSTWNIHYDNMEANWMWLQAIQAQVEEKTETLVDWALEASSQPG
ncbi:hypothetical protein N7492_003278 [Penicillium capsulatum]|uniref:F-box domain-containing protein n=1 Tax=Penicillium capsulatum TaxID=69766 RepID=A0A9W9LW24_9EURO|nr:hypothetical protein N7492_003278 [Penicillium capsulatum]KAJ6122136.1 hypothetical protein N7512_004601 [Penicillium capsulatum]